MKKLLFALIIGFGLSGCYVGTAYYPDYTYCDDLGCRSMTVRTDAYGVTHYYDATYNVWISPGHPFYHRHYHHYYYRGGSHYRHR